MNRVGESVQYLLEESQADTLEAEVLASLLRKRISELADVQDINE
jgi:hypothetical protein